MLTLLVTRPEPDASRTALSLRARGHEVLVAPLLRIETLSAELGAGPWAAVLITSASAARAAAAHPDLARIVGLPLLAVGGRSAEAARAAGFTDVSSADGDAEDLVQLARRQPVGRLLYLAGRDRTGDLAGRLAASGHVVDTIEVYRAVAETRLPTPVEQALAAGEIDGVLHFSRRTALAFVAATDSAMLRGKTLEMHHFCLSAQVAEPLRAVGVTRVKIAPLPDEAALLRLEPIGPR
ncbi:MAG: uroporphyrinogen synthase [Xanthobacteraceae bacterium]|nr:uroporphyrinogen synthase [Xanthobacteraceae bacterium]